MLADEPSLPETVEPPAAQEAASPVVPHLPTELKEDGTLVIDLTALNEASEDCEVLDPNPLDPGIVVCGEANNSPRIGPDAPPEVDEFGNAIPRARIRLSDHAEAQANVINKAVGGWNANGSEVRIRIEF